MPVQSYMHTPIQGRSTQCSKVGGLTFSAHVCIYIYIYIYIFAEIPFQYFHLLNLMVCMNILVWAYARGLVMQA